jgi:hypothetical protein
MAGIEWANRLLGRRHRLANEITGTLGAIRGDDHPAAGDRVFAQLRQSGTSFRVGTTANT